MNRDELFIEHDLLKGRITRMMYTDDIEELCTILCVVNDSLSKIFKENLKRINEQDKLKEQILEEASEIEDEYSTT